MAQKKIQKTQLDAAVQTSLDAADSALQSVDIADINATGTADSTTYLRGDGSWATPAGGGASALDDLSDVVITAAASGEFIRHNGTNWVDATIQAGDIPDLSATYLTVATAASTYQPLDAGLTDIAALAVTDGNIIVGDGTNWVAESGATARTSLGLGNVENTALSTWAGSTNITTLGTIGTGTWQGTAIADSYISSAATWNAKIANVVEDTTPQLGGSLDVNGQKIVSVSNGNIDIEPNGTGNVLLGNFTFDADQTVGAGQDNYVLTYDNATGLISLEAATGGGSGTVSSGTAGRFAYYTGATTVDDLSAIEWDSTNTRIDIGSFGSATDLAFGSFDPRVVIADDVDAIAGVEMRNKSTGTTADFRFVVSDNTRHYLAFAMPGPNNSASLFGAQRKTSSYIFSNTTSGGTNRNLTIGTVHASDLIFGTNNTERMRIESGGDVGIGTTNPTTKLEVSGVITATGGNSTNWNTAYGWGDHASAGYATASSTTTFTNKTFDANGTGNSLSNVEVADFAASAIVTAAEGLASSDNDTTVPTTAAVIDYVGANGGSTVSVESTTGTTHSLTTDGSTTVLVSAVGQVALSGGSSGAYNVDVLLKYNGTTKHTLTVGMPTGSSDGNKAAFSLAYTEIPAGATADITVETANAGGGNGATLSNVKIIVTKIS